MENIIKKFLIDSAKIKIALAESDESLESIKLAATQLLKTVTNKGTIYICGNGGSACDAIHFCEELVARYKRERPGIRAQHLMDAATMTCWSNDYDFNTVFSRQVETMCDEKDTLVLFSTSGNSKNIIEALQAAKKVNCKTIGLTGRTGGEMAELTDILIKVPGEGSDRIQESHITLVHIFCEILETSDYIQKSSSSALESGLDRATY